ncbi:hypothetical protein BESB_030330 [Besnoitia besnoiti]|uniref:Transmembrane protein n=1 Tax=Besnoitia besnoiti TaxID=94643 RepID=A0A2A9LZJ7_BESBE|nr:hypothetical protein BESB_030330 [Besnoitia besnoiti]PFH31159.1 hypothetical protein BESB_030330 [Besnoitia besnoiti]
MPFLQATRRGGRVAPIRFYVHFLLLLFITVLAHAYEGPRFGGEERRETTQKTGERQEVAEGVSPEDATELVPEPVDGLREGDVRGTQERKKAELPARPFSASEQSALVEGALNGSHDEPAKMSIPSAEKPEQQSFYGRMLQAVSDFLFSDADDADVDDVGFLSRRRRAPSVPEPESAHDTQMTNVPAESEPTLVLMTVSPDDAQIPAKSTDLHQAYQGVAGDEVATEQAAYVDLGEADTISTPPTAESSAGTHANSIPDTPSRDDAESSNNTRLQRRKPRLNWGRGPVEPLRPSSPATTTMKKLSRVATASALGDGVALPQHHVSSSVPFIANSHGVKATTNTSGSPVLSSTTLEGWEEKAKGLVSLVEHASKILVSPQVDTGSQAASARNGNFVGAVNSNELTLATPFSQGLASLLIRGKTQGGPMTSGGSTAALQKPLSSSPEAVAYAALSPPYPARSSVTLDALRHSDGLGKTFVQGVDVGSAVVDVLTSTRELQEALSALNIPGLPVSPSAPARQASENRDGLSLASLVNAAKAVQQFTNWAATVDKAINTTKEFTQSVPATLRGMSLRTASEADESDDSLDHEVRTEVSRQTRNSEEQRPDGRTGGVLNSPLRAQGGTTTVKGAANSYILGSQPRDYQDAQITDSRLKTENSDSEPRSMRTSTLSSSDTASTIDSKADGEEGKRPVPSRQLQQIGSASEGPMRLLSRGAAMMDDMAQALKKEEAVSAAAEGGGEYVIGLARDLQKMASFFFNVLDVTVSVADESMNALQLGHLMDTYKSLAEEGALAPLGVKASGAPPEHMGKPTVSCVNKGMTCCVPAAAAPDWKTSPLHLQNEQRRECKANFVTRSNMLCATTPYKNSKCGIIHTKANGYNKYATVLPVAGFTATAMCECEVSKQKSSEGLYSFKGTASWTAPGKPATRDLIQEAKNGWQFVKSLTKGGNQMLGVLENTLNPQRSPITSMADVMTKLVVNQQLQKIAEAADPVSAVFPSISVGLFPKKPLLTPLAPLSSLPRLSPLQALTRPVIG